VLRAQFEQVVRPAPSPHDGQGKHRPGRSAHGLAIERIRAPGREQQGIGAEGGGIASHGAQVVDIHEVHQHHHQAGAVGNARASGALGDGQATTVDVETGHLVHHGLRNHVDGELAPILEQERFERGQPGRREHHRADVQRGGEQLANDQLALGDEMVVRVVESAISQVAVVRQPGVVERSLGQEM
jgi:hypothetical protein